MKCCTWDRKGGRDDRVFRVLQEDRLLRVLLEGSKYISKAAFKKKTSEKSMIE